MLECTTGAGRPKNLDSAFRESARATGDEQIRSEEHTSELQSRLHLVCRLLLEKKNEGNAHRDLVFRCTRSISGSLSFLGDARAQAPARAHASSGLLAPRALALVGRALGFRGPV